MKKLILLTILLGLLLPCGASAAGLDLVKALGVMTGYEDGSFGGEDLLTRGQFAKIVVAMADKSFTPVGSVSPYGDVPHTHWAAPYIARASDLGLLSGYPDGSFRPEKEVAAEEAAKILLALLGYDTAASGDWGKHQITAAQRAGILKETRLTAGGSVSRFDAARMVENTFLAKPDGGNVYYIETLGYAYFPNAVIITDKTTQEDKVATSVGVFGKNGRVGAEDLLKSGGLVTDEYGDIAAFLPKSQALKSYVVRTVLEKGIAVFAGEEQIEIEDDLRVYSGERQLPYQSAKTELKAGDRLTLYLDGMGKAEYAAVEKNAMKGPVTNYGASFAASLGAQGEVAVFRDGVRTALSALKDYDVCYYIEDDKTVLAYSRKATGVYEKALPNKDNPNAIVLSGVSYEIGHIEAFRKLSSGGSLRFGDTVTLLLDMNGKIADAVSSKDALSRAWFLIDTGRKENVVENNETVYQHYARLAALDGQEAAYVTDRDYNALRGRLVSVSFQGGKAALAAAGGKTAVSGVFDWTSKTLGREALAGDLKIMDVAPFESYRAGKHAFVFPQRIHMTDISPGKVLFAGRNQSGEITSLVLDNVTNDMYGYGIVVKASSVTAGVAARGEYELLIGGQEAQLLSASAVYPVHSGQPVRIDMEAGQIKGMTGLTAVSERITGIDEAYLHTDAGKRRLSDKLLVYRKTTHFETSYEVLPLSRVIADQLSFEAYFDRPEKSGGAVRVLLVRE